MNFVQHVKNQAISSICCGDVADIKMVQSVWLKTFWPISKELDFPKYGLCAENSINFHYKINSEKINDQFFQLLKKNYF